MAIAYIPPNLTRDPIIIVAPAQSPDGLLACKMMERVRADSRRLPRLLEVGYEVFSSLNIVRDAPLTLGPKVWNLTDAAARMKVAAARQGIDLDKVLECAAKNFMRPTFTPDTSRLTPEELEAVVKHDDKSLED